MAAKSKHASRDGFIRPQLVALVRFLLMGSAAISIYLIYASLRGGGVAGCGPQSGCQIVLNSRWAYWFGIPVSAPALLYYLVIIGATFSLGAKKSAASHRQGWAILIPGAIVISVAALWFLVLQVAVLKALCPYCLAAHGLGVAAAIILLLHAPFRPAPEKPWEQERQVFIPRATSRKLIIASAAVIAGMVAGQTLYVRTGYRVSNVSAGLVDKASGGGREFQIYNGKFKLDLNETPILGNPGASNIMLSLFDYTCHYCRTMHPRLVAAQQMFSNDLAIVNLPMPLDEKCNFTIAAGKTPAEHSNACEYARIALAVWKADRAKLTDFDEWVFKFQTTPPLEAAKAFAQRLVGPLVLENMLADPSVQRQVLTNVGIYATSYYTYSNGAMPQLIIGTNITSGILEMEQLLYMLQKQFGLTTERTNPVHNPP